MLARRRMRQVVLGCCPEASDKDIQYCYICEDGGQVMECSFCTKSFCYGILGEPPNDPEHSPCVSVSAQMVKEENHLFPCPDCLSQAQARSAPVSAALEPQGVN
jgi:predicted RNA-binding Zn-ribbon protein involved in translation (DUF1610 family)